MGRLTHTVSGSIATVRSPAVAPIESLKVHFSPIQEGTGDPSPSNIRPITGWTGVNTTKVRSIWDGRYEKGYINASGQIVSNNDTFVNAGYIDIIPNSKIKFRFTKTNISAANIHLFYYNENKEYITDRWIGPNGDINISANTRYIRFQMDTAYSATYDGKDLSVYYSDEAETIPVTFPAVGKNLFDKNSTPFQTGKYISDVISGVPQYTTNSNYNVYKIPIKSSTTYTFGPIKGGNGAIWGTMQKAQNIMSRYEFNNGGNEGTTHTFTSYSGDGYLLLSVAINGAYKCDDILQLEEGSSATTYEAFDNTMYGGYVDLATGDVYKEYKRIVYDGSEDENWGKLTSGSATAFGMYMSASDKEKALYSDISSNYLKTISHNATWGNYDNWISDNVSEIATGIQSITTVSAWKEYLSEHNLVVCYKLKTPLRIATLTPQELATFKGYSNFWSNAGDVDVTYQVVESSEMTKERQKIFAGNAPTIHTASGSVANFEMEPGLNRNLKSCKVGFLPVQEGSGDPFPPINQNGSIVGVDNLHNESELSSFKIHFSPIQAGSGDPSPTNVRPITGWTGVTGYKGGKNLLEYPVFWLQAGLSPVHEDTFFIKAGTYKLSLNISNATTWRIGILTKTLNGELTGQDNEYLPVINNMNLGWYTHHWGQVSDNQQTEYTVVIPRDCYVRFMLHSGDTSASTTITNGQLEVGSTATSYEAYSAPTSYPVSWESQGTVYGGYVDLVSGDVVATMLYKKHRVGDSHVDATYENTKRIDVLLDNDCLSKANGTTSNTISSYFTYAYNNLDNPHFYLTDPNRIRCFVPIDIDDNTEIEFICTLLNSIVVATLTPQQIALVTGKSSYWSNADAVTIETVGNVRPINGFGKINTTRCSKNLYHYDENNVKVESLNSGLVRAVYHTGIYGDGRNFVLSAHRKDPNVGSTANINLGYCKNGINYVPDYFITTSEERTPTCKRLTGEEITLVLVSSSDAALKSNLQRFDIQIEFGTTPSTYEPYNGDAYSITFPAQGKNLFDISKLIVGKALDGYGELVVNVSRSTMDYIYLTPGTYTISRKTATDYWKAYKYNLNYVKDYNLFNNATRKNTFTIDSDCYIRISFDDIPTSDDEIQLELSSTETAYEPYSNTLYGGYADLNTGELTATYGRFNLGDNSIFKWHYGGGNGTIFFGNIANNSTFKKVLSNNDVANMYCEQYKVVSYSAFAYNNSNDLCIGWDTIGAPRIRNNAYNGTTIQDFIASLNGVYAIVELATPIQYQLTPTQIQALKGTNNILSDANGIIEVKYWSH